MDLLSEEEIKPRSGFSFAPMIDFLFLMLALFATLAVSRASLFDTDIDLVQMNSEAAGNKVASKEIKNVHLSINDLGNYAWMTDLDHFPMETTTKIQEEMVRQYDIGLFPKDKSKTEVLLHIDKSAPWQSIAQAIFAIKEIGFSVHPVYEQGD